MTMQELMNNLSSALHEYNRTNGVIITNVEFSYNNFSTMSETDVEYHFVITARDKYDFKN